ncbi:hypothetical protein FACS189485_20260 [Spirochaetia bacterium]|nr:hypothetical protein FACS189485_20260 [Spirochaetia bacterium]
MAIKFSAANLGKIITAGMIALFVLNLLCFVYYNIPGHFSSVSGATDYVYPKYAHYIHMTEGFGYGRLNNEGLNNLNDFNSQKIDVVIMGSSQMEGLNVAQTKTTAAILNKLFYESKYVYNIGFSTHDFCRNINNLANAVQYYKPTEYVVFEIQDVKIGIQELEDVVNSKMKRLPAFNNGILSYLQRMPYLRLGYRQVKLFTGIHVVDTLKIIEHKNTSLENVPVIDEKEQYSILLDAVMHRINQISINNNIKPIIFYHPHLTLNKDGSASANTNDEYLDAFKAACINNGIYFLDMTAVFMEEYQTNHILPYGFANTAVGAGHLNKNGHRIIANELFRRINEIEKGGSL